MALPKGGGARRRAGAMPTYLDDFQQLGFIYAAVPILVVHLERPPQLVLQLPPQNEIQGSHIFQKINGVILWQQRSSSWVTLGWVESGWKSSLSFQRSWVGAARRTGQGQGFVWHLEGGVGQFRTSSRHSHTLCSQAGLLPPKTRVSVLLKTPVNEEWDFIFYAQFALQLS